jgi:hypothetical protein
MHGAAADCGRKVFAEAESTPGEFRGSKQAKIVELMKRPKGATLDELVEAMDWLPHTLRAALTGLRKRGLRVERVKDEGRGSPYRIDERPCWDRASGEVGSGARPYPCRPTGCCGRACLRCKYRDCCSSGGAP